MMIFKFSLCFTIKVCLVRNADIVIAYGYRSSSLDALSKTIHLEKASYRGRILVLSF